MVVTAKKTDEPPKKKPPVIRRGNAQMKVVRWLFFFPLSSVSSFAFSSRLHHLQPQILLQALASKKSTVLLQQDVQSSSAESSLRWRTPAAVFITSPPLSSAQQRRGRRDPFIPNNNILYFWKQQRDPQEQDQRVQQQQQQQLLVVKPNVSAQWILGVLFSLGVLYALASGYDTATTIDATSILSSPSASVSGVFPVERLDFVVDNIIDAAVPMTAYDVVSVSLGEGVAGLMGGLVSGALSVTIRQLAQQQLQSRKRPQQQQRSRSVLLDDKTVRKPLYARSSSMAASTTATPMLKPTTVVKGSEVVASGDFFLTRAAALPLLEATGLSQGLANLVATVVATVPYELVKLATRRREQQLEGDRRMRELLEEEQDREKRRMPFANLFAAKPAASVDPESLKPVQNEMKIDFVEIFSDITKWLEYSVLTEQLGGSLAWSGLTSAFPLTESFIFGALASLSAQVYADILYAFSGFGGEEKQKEVLSRTISEWSALYLSSCITGATLFGVYESSHIPAKFLASAFFSGGVEGCMGSNDYNLCAESFLFSNPPPGPSLEAQGRALFTTLVSIWNQLGFDSFPFSH